MLSGLVQLLYKFAHVCLKLHYLRSVEPLTRTPDLEKLGALLHGARLFFF